MTDITLMSTERRAFAQYLPTLQKALTGRSLLDLEARGSDALALFKVSDAPALTVPVEMGGLGASALESTRIHRAIGALSPSLGAAATMHHLSIATLIEHSRGGTQAERDLIAGLVAARTVIASGFSEGKPGGSAFKPTVTARPVEGGYLVNGRKQPCSLSKSMDLLTASVAKATATGDDRRGVIVIPAATPGISVEQFWTTDILAAAESDTVLLTDVFVPADLVFWDDVDDPTGQHLKTGYVWFGLLISATYIGAASALLERLLNHGKAEPLFYLQAACEVEAAMSSIEGIARAFDAGDRSDELSARLLFCREALKASLRRSVAAAAEALGGIDFIRSPEIAYLVSAVQAASFHPPSKKSAAESLLSFHSGGQFTFT
jgi:alkylation response protein AidB-like acyl-CoA dehydrogenase